MQPFQIKTRHLLISMVPIALTLAFWFQGVVPARVAARRSQCQGSLFFNGAMLRDIRSRTGRYPSAVVVGPGGVPMHSWRAPTYLECPSFPVLKYDLTTPWNSPTNRPFAATLPGQFRCPNNQDEPGRFANFVAVMDRGVSTFDHANMLPRDSPAEAAQPLLIEYPNSDILWTEPRDLDVTELPRLATGNDPGGLGVLFADGRFHRLPRAEVLKLFGR